MTNVEKRIEQRARYAAKRGGEIVRKSRVKNTHSDNQGGYMIIHARSNNVLLGERYDLTLADLCHRYKIPGLPI